MDTVSQSDDTSLNIQNDYFNRARKGHTRVTVVLTNGQRISGFIRSFDKYTLILDTRNGDQMIFKHAISTVAPTQAVDRDVRGPRPRRPHPGERGEHRQGGPPGRHGPPRPPAEGARPREGGPAARGPNVRQRVASGPQGKAFGNYMDLSAVSKGAPAPKLPETAARPPDTAARPPETEAKPPETAAKPPETVPKPPETEAKPPETEAKPPETAPEPPETAAKPPEIADKPTEESAKPEPAGAAPPVAAESAENSPPKEPADQSADTDKA